MLLKKYTYDCPYCKKPFQQLKRHLKAKHSDEVKVQEMLKGTSKEKKGHYV